jgi:signal transduction histidine kinase
VRSLIHPADLSLVIERFQRLSNGERPPPETIRLLQSSGEYRPVEVSAQPEMEEGKVKDVWVLVRDVSKDEQLNKQREEIAQEKRQVQSLMDLIRAAAARARSPLSAIYLHTYLLSRRVAVPAALSSVEKIEGYVQQLTLLSERVLTMAELDSDRVHFSFGRVQLNGLVVNIVTSMQPLAEAKQIVFTIEPAQGLPPVRADEIQLSRAVREVVENALEYTPEYGSVTIRTFRKDSSGVIKVQDTGGGIAPEFMPHLFARFYHFNLPTSAPEKLGLGLPIAKKIIDKHGGTIEVVSAPNKGSTVTIAIPLSVP